ncbi:hypothetical protein FACS189485_03420 [Spirochaetia bacterium]|nr:hypothetical protein FACS189485_03420 [Spirochaetia bacterium]
MDKQKKLYTIKLVKQKLNSKWCGAACAKMVFDYYDKPIFSLEETWGKVSERLSNNIENCRTYKIENLFIGNGFFSMVIRFTDLRGILNYCQDNQIPAIMNVHSIMGAKLSHFIVFKGYDTSGNAIKILDPEDETRHVVQFPELEDSFKKYFDGDDVGGNTIILVKQDMQNIKEIVCPICGCTHIIDPQIEPFIDAVLCPNNDRWF